MKPHLYYHHGRWWVDLPLGRRLSCSDFRVASYHAALWERVGRA